MPLWYARIFPRRAIGYVCCWLVVSTIQIGSRPSLSAAHPLQPVSPHFANNPSRPASDVSGSVLEAVQDANGPGRLKRFQHSQRTSPRRLEREPEFY